MHYGRINFNDIGNGIGIRTSIFVSGCRNRCEQCFNPETWDFNYGTLFTMETEKEIFDSMDEYHHGITILGGDPLEPENSETLYHFVKKFKELFPDKSIWLYTGYKYEFILGLRNDDFRKRLMFAVDIVVDGRYLWQEADISLKFKGSRNQRIIDIKKTIERHPYKEPVVIG